MNTTETQYTEDVTRYASLAERICQFDAEQIRRFSHSLSCDLGRANIRSNGLKFGKPSKKSDGKIDISSKGKTADKVIETYAFTLAATLDMLFDAEKRGMVMVTKVTLPKHLQFLAKAQETPANVQTGQPVTA